MKRVFALITAAGASTRFGARKKELERLGPLTVLETAIRPFLPLVEGMVITCPADLRSTFEALLMHSMLAPQLQGLSRGWLVAEGGVTRQDSVRLGLEVLASLHCGDADIVLIHDGARPWVSEELIRSVIEGTRTHGACIPLSPLTETPKVIEGRFIVGHPVRDSVMTAQTPQGFLFGAIRLAHARAVAEGYAATDDAMLHAQYSGPVSWVQGEPGNRKITFREDLPGLEQTMAHVPRIGQGYDIHPLVEGRKLIIGGVVIPHDRGEAGHSDGDVLWHAVIDALLGAAAMGDIGSHFPPTDPRWKDADSGMLAAQVVAMLSEQGWTIGNLDTTVILERPKLAPYREQIRASLAKVTGIPLECVSCKAKTNEGFDAAGAGEAIAAQAAVLLVRRS